MYRLACNPGTGTVVQFVVTEQIIDIIETIFGPTNEDGFFADAERFKLFMANSNYLCELVGQKFVNAVDGISFVLPWEYIIKNRYEDIIKKLRDKEHEYHSSVSAVDQDTSIASLC